MNPLDQESLPDHVFGTLKEARDAVDKLFQDEGYIMTILRTRHVGNKHSGEVKGLDLACSCSGILRTTSLQQQQQQRQRIRGSRATACKFSLLIRRRAEFEWPVELSMHDHSHAAFVDPKVHPQGRALTNEQHAVVLGFIS